MQINWEILSTCNQNCYYCFNKCSERKNDFNLNEVVINRIIDVWKNLEQDKYTITLTGGEPTISPFLPYIIDQIFLKIGGNLSKISFITNLTQSIEYFKNNFFYLNKEKFFIRVSIHPEYFDEKKKEILLGLINNKFNLKVSLLFDIRDNYYRKKSIDLTYWLNQFHYIKNQFEPSLRKIFGQNIPKYNQSDLNFLNQVNKKWNYQTYFQNNKFRGKNCCFGNLITMSSDLMFSNSYCPQAKFINVPIIYMLPKKILEKITYKEKCRMSCCQIPTNYVLEKNKKRRLAIGYKFK